MSKPIEDAREKQMDNSEKTGTPEPIRLVARDFLEPITTGEGLREPEAYVGSIGRTMFDTPSAEDGTVAVLLPKEHIEQVPLQSLVRIHSVADERHYLGIIVSGPFAQPDGLRADANVIVTTTVRGGIFMPRYHGLVHVELLGEEVDGQLVPPRRRPHPNSPVFVLPASETAEALHAGGEVRIGLAIGDDEIIVGAPADRKSVLPRHTAVLGTTGGGKSTTITGMIGRAQAAGFAVILLDTEGEYVLMDQPTDDRVMLAALRKRNMEPQGITTHLYHLANTGTANAAHPRLHTFGLSFTTLSPYTVAEIVTMSDAQQERFHKAFEIGKQVLREQGIFPRRDHPDDEERALELNDFDEGYPELTLQRLLDLVMAGAYVADKDADSYHFSSPEFERVRDSILAKLHAAKPTSAISWRATYGRLNRFRRMNIFDQPRNRTLDHRALLTPGQVSVIDMSDTDSTVLNNIVIADLLRNLQRAQDETYREWESGGRTERPPKVLIVVEEAHEFLSKDRIAKMPILFEQVARIARRGRKRWLGLVFVTQLPQQLPREVIGLVNNFVLHKITDEGVLHSLRQIVPGIDENLWRRTPALAPGQAIVSFTHMARPLLVSVDPAPCRLRLIE
jgi:DNA helicase HerA-like ATPase